MQRYLLRRLLLAPLSLLLVSVVVFVILNVTGGPVGLYLGTGAPRGGPPRGGGAAVRRGSWIDQTIGWFSVLGLSMPSFWLGIMLIIFFAVRLHWLPTSGMGSPRHYGPPS